MEEISAKLQSKFDGDLREFREKLASGAKFTIEEVRDFLRPRVNIDAAIDKEEKVLCRAAIGSLFNVGREREVFSVPVAGTPVFRHINFLDDTEISLINGRVQSEVATKMFQVGRRIDALRQTNLFGGGYSKDAIQSMINELDRQKQALEELLAS